MRLIDYTTKRPTRKNEDGAFKRCPRCGKVGKVLYSREGTTYIHTAQITKVMGGSFEIPISRDSCFVP